MAVNVTTTSLTQAASHQTNGSKQPFNPDGPNDNRLHSQLTHNAPVSTAKILSRSDPTSGTISYTLQIGSVKIPSVSAFEIFDYISPYDLEVFENASFKSEIAAQELAAKNRQTEEPKRGPGRPKRAVQTSESDDSDSRDARDGDANGATTLLGGRRPRPNYTHFYPKQRAKRGGVRDDSVQVVVETKNQGGFVRPGIPGSNAASSVSSRSERQHKRQKRESSSSSAAESVYSIASLPVQQSSLVKAAERVTSKVPKSRSPADVEMIEASLNAPPSRESSTAKTAKAKLSESPTEMEMIEASLPAPTPTDDKGKGKARMRVSLSESPMDVGETPLAAPPSTQKPTESKAKAVLSSRDPVTNISNKIFSPLWKREGKATDRASETPSATASRAKGAFASATPSSKARVTDTAAVSVSKAKARLSDTPSAPASKAGVSGNSSASVSKPVSLPTATPKTSAKPTILKTPSTTPNSSTPRATFEAALKAKSPQKPTSRAAAKAPTASASKAPVPLSSKAAVASSSKAPSIPSSSKAPAPNPSSSQAPSKLITIDSSSSSSPSSESDSDDEETYTVERILTHCLSDPRTHTSYGPLPVWLFQVKWEGYEELTWEPVQSFEDEEMLEEYWAGTLNGIRGERYR